ncbi:DUF4142 domain-containing protein [Rufibacter sp. H-1]|uniref:DUF4142 domain-containing protein n=1 Tax=Rufibacter sediminis TaxID=2762756 RepID=A0ABR6VUM4_9BACT|nr:DUF4142 domain-containing protein [Rufibacter sediminis]MBC3540865.1 DUF4142 domain-containing protein [Rufibacter sediminis]
MPLFAAAILLTGAACSTYTSSTDPDNYGTGYGLTDEKVGTGHNSSMGVAEANNNATLDNPATGSNTDSLNATQNPDQLFMMKAASGGMMEVAAGKLASTKGQDPAVKQFGQRMVTDHTKANTELKAIAAKKGVTLPTALLPEHQQHLDMLTQLSDAEFDRSYTQHMVQAHDKDIAEFDRQAKSGTDADLKAFAAKNLPILREHRKLVQPIYEKVNRSGASNTEANAAPANGGASGGGSK